MGQPRVTFLGNDNLDYTITVGVHDRRIEFFIKPDFYRSAISRVKNSIDSGYFNQAVTILVTHSERIIFEGKTYPREAYVHSSPVDQEKQHGKSSTRTNRIQQDTIG